MHKNCTKTQAKLIFIILTCSGKKFRVFRKLWRYGERICSIISIWIHCCICHCGSTNREHVPRTVIRCQCHCFARIICCSRWCPRHRGSRLSCVCAYILSGRCARYNRNFGVWNSRFNQVSSKWFKSGSRGRGVGTDLEKGYGDVRPWRLPFTPLL